ncbi:MAG: DUF1573 domain-containing protein, partial [Armatimonadetes bacterium]|nr:DUF1573 domain-containing protein [Armatimonadota bacterium]
MGTITRLQLLTVFSCLCIIAFPQLSPAQCSDCGKSDLLCGPRCLLVVCQKFGEEANLEELTALSGTDEQGTSLIGLHAVARAKGLEAVAMKIGVDELEGLKCPAMAHLWNNHFVVVEADSPDKLRVTNPPGEPKVTTTEEFKKHYSGFALLVSRDKSLFPAPKDSGGADLRVDGYSWNFAPVEEGAKLDYVFTCRNEGSEELLISKVDTSCGCTQALAVEERIPPGGKGEIWVSFDSNGRQGVQWQTVYIRCNDPVTPTVQLQVGGVVRPAKLIYSPRTVNFGKVRTGEEALREIVIPKSDVRDIEIKQVTCDSPFVSAGLAMRIDRSADLICLRLAPDAPLGKMSSKITIETNHPKDPKVEVPITGSVKGHIDIFPDTLFFGMLKEGEGG